MSKNPEDWDSRPARIQVDPETVHGPNRQMAAPMGTVYNLWYHRWSGGDTTKISRQRPTTKVDVALDAGRTRAGGKETFICLFFARGSCPHGYQCRYWHRLPEPSDRVPVTKDCFGRDLFAQLREDLGGLGSFLREHTTLYVGRINADYPDAEEVLRKHFDPFGYIVRIKVLEGRGVSFVTYAWRHEAEFAKEAMSNQSLDANEMINVRWASEDPDPRAKEEFRRKAEQEMRQRIEAKAEREAAKLALIAPPAQHQLEYDEAMEEGEMGVRVDASEAKGIEAPVPELPPLPETMGFLHPDTLRNIQVMIASIPGGIHFTADKVRSTAPQAPVSSLALISGYRSD